MYPKVSFLIPYMRRLLGGVASFAVLCGAASAQFDAFAWTFDDLSSTGGFSQVVGDRLDIMVNPSCLFADFEYGSAEMIAPRTGRFTFRYDATSTACAGFGGACIATRIYVVAGDSSCPLLPSPTSPPPNCNYQADFFNDGSPYFGGQQFGVGGNWSIDVKKGDTLRITAVSDGWSLDCQILASFVDLVFRPSLIATTGGVSVGSGGSVALDVTAPVALAGAPYLVLGSASGTQPGVPIGSSVIPLNSDTYTLHTFLNPNSPPLLNGFGTLDANAQAQATFQLPPGLNPSLVGLQVHHAAIALGAPGASELSFVSNPVALMLLP